MLAKHTVDTLGADWFKAQIQERAGIELAPPKDWSFERNGDQFGWSQGENGNWHLGLRINSGRLIDSPNSPLLTGMREIANVHTGHFRLTCNQNLIVADVAAEDKASIDALVEQYQLDSYKTQSGIARNTIACVALPTCALAMAESERYAPIILPKLNTLLEQHGLLEQEIVFRISGCPNGCARPYLAEIALVGRAPGRYDLRLAPTLKVNVSMCCINKTLMKTPSSNTLTACLNDMLLNVIKMNTLATSYFVRKSSLSRPRNSSL